MKNTIVKIASFAFVAAALMTAPALSQAQDSTNAPAAQAPKKHPNVIHGKVAAVDATAMTFTIGNSTLSVTSETKLSKEGKPAVFADITVGENVACSVQEG